MLLSFHKFPSPWSRTPAVSPAFPWLLPKFANPQIIAKTIENKKNSAESTRNRSIRWISHPLSSDLAKKFSVAIHTEDQKMQYVVNTFGHRIIDILLYRPELLYLACCKWEQFYDEQLPFSPLALTQEVAQFSESSRIAVEEFREVADDPSPFSEDGFEDITLF